ncbi:MAG: hypothetical protein ACOX4G_07550 [Limnochordia bacterium]|jgi:hypothetical protein
MRVRRVIKVRPGECVVICCDRRPIRSGRRPKPTSCIPCRWRQEMITRCRRRSYRRDYDDY